jgi:hypothetical protein
MTIKKLSVIAFFFLLVNTANWAQTKNQPSEYFDDAEFFFDDGDYREALYNFLKVHEKDTSNANINYCIGMCYINIPGEETKAIKYFEKAKNKISTKYKKGAFEEKNAPLLLLFYLGNAYRVNNELTKALDVYKKFRDDPYFDGHYNAKMVDDEIATCQRAKLVQDNPLNVRFTNLGSFINNAQSNRNPVVNKDETILIYLSSLKFYDAIMMSRKDSSGWGEPENISDQVGSDGDCEPTCLSQDGKDLYMVKKTKGNFDIYVSHWKNGVWTAMQPLNKNINSSKNETSASVSADGKTLYFSSDRRGGFGKFDIYKSERMADDDWGPAENLGETVNTENDDIDPFICEDGKTLYFSSQGHLNMGDFDIFTTKLMPNKKWETPVNVGFPINTTGRNVFFYPLRNGEIGYYATVRPDGFGKEDIYKIENLTLQARNNRNANDKKNSKVIIRDKTTNEVIGALYTENKTDSLKSKQAGDKNIKPDKQ